MFICMKGKIFLKGYSESKPEVSRICSKIHGNKYIERIKEESGNMHVKSNSREDRIGISMGRQEI